MTETAPHMGPDPHSDKPAVIMGSNGETISHAEMNKRSMKVAQLLYAQGLRPGDHIAIIMENNPRYFEIAWAAQRSGLYFTPVNWHLTAKEAEYIVRNCEAKAVFTSSAVAEMAGHIALDSAVKVRLVTDGPLAGFDVFENAVEDYPAEPLTEEVEGSAMCYSSGTTGRPKGILRPLARAPFGSGTLVEAMLSELYPFSADTIYLSPGPLYHAAPIYWTMCVQRFGGTAVVMERFDPREALRLIERYRVTMAQFVPTMFIRMLKLGDEERYRYDLSTLECAVHGAAPCPIWAKEEMLKWWGPIIHEYLGSTEAGFVAIGPEEWLEHKGSVGKPRFNKAHILDEDGRECPVGEIGAVYYESVDPFEYHGDPRKSADAFNDQGWVTVGDMGHMDEHGYLYLCDRRSNMIISGGVNIYPQEVENLLLSHGAIADAAVIGVPDEEYGEQVKAVVKLTDPAMATPAMAQELITWCRSRMAHFKCPRSVDFVTELPRVESGKLLKRKLKDQYAANSKPAPG